MNKPFSKVEYKKVESSSEYATEEYLVDHLKVISAKSHLPIKQLLSLMCKNQLDSISCSKDDTNYYFFATLQKKKISVTIKQLGKETVEFDVPKDKIESYVAELSMF